jgi:Antistasin family
MTILRSPIALGLSFGLFAVHAVGCVVQATDAPPPTTPNAPVATGTAPPPAASGKPDYSTLPTPQPAPTSTAPPVSGRECPPVDCDLACAHGFAKDARGCEACMCRPAPGPGRKPGAEPGAECVCRSDADCVKVSDAGCCGCSAGGTEQSVAKACLDQVPKCNRRDVMCPQVYQCTDRKAVCQGGTCTLK